MTAVAPLRAPVEEALSADLAAVQRSLRRQSRGPPTRIHQAAQHTLLAGGKQARPLLTCAVIRALGEDPTPVIDLVAAVELAHVGSLLHDDVVDGGLRRRGRVAAHLAFDAHTAILAGDCLLSWMMQTLARGAPRALQVAMTEAIVALSAGEALERERLFDADVDPPHVREVHRLKTAALFAYAAEAGGVLAWADAETRAALRTFGETLGLAFQAVDDLLDWQGDAARLGKPAGRDLAEGVVNLPLALALDADPTLRAELAELWREPREPAALAPERLADTGAFAGAAALAERDCAAATAALESLPASPWRAYLVETARRSLSRHV